MDRLDQLLTEPEYPSLLHGDMWGGKLFDASGADGETIFVSGKEPSLVTRGFGFDSYIVIG